MVKKFKETSIPEDFSKNLVSHQVLVGASHSYRIATTMFHGVSSCLGAMKNTGVAKAIVFRSINGAFIMAAKVEYIGNTDDPSNVASGRWDYTWTTNEEDIKGADCIDVSTNSLVQTYFTSSGINLFGMKFNDPTTCVLIMITMAEVILNWLKENAKEGTTTELSLDGVFQGISSVEDGKVVVGIIPDGEMKVLIKDDSAIQER